MTIYAVVAAWHAQFGFRDEKKLKIPCKNSGGYPYNIMSKAENECAEKKQKKLKFL